MLYHHGKESYEVAAGAAAQQARAKMQSIIKTGELSAQQTWENVFRNAITDALVAEDKVIFDVEGNALTMHVPEVGTMPVTDHALGQLCVRAGVPGPFARMLLTHESPLARNLLPELVETLSRVSDTTKCLVRIVDNQVRAVLSDSYKRRDSRPLLEAFGKAAGARGLVPVFGASTEIKHHFRVMLPRIFEPVEHEVMCFGLEWRNSDFGAGAHEIKMFMLRLWCTNTAIGERMLREVHLGKQLDEIGFSRKTYELEAQTAASAMEDIVHAWIDDGRIKEYCDVIRRAHETKVDAAQELAKLYKSNKVSKAERDSISEIYNKPDVEILPAVGGNSAWRFSNAISYFAQQVPSAMRARELESLAGQVLPTLRSN